MKWTNQARGKKLKTKKEIDEIGESHWIVWKWSQNSYNNKEKHFLNGSSLVDTQTDNMDADADVCAWVRECVRAYGQSEH